MSPCSTSFAVKGLTAFAVAAVQIALLGVMALDVKNERDDGGEAPVINVSLRPVIAYDGASGAQKSVAFEEPSRSRPKLKDRVQETLRPSTLPKMRHIETPIVMDEAYAMASAAPQTRNLLVSELGDSGVAEASQGAMSSTSSTASRQGVTQGGAGRRLGASGGRSTDDYEAEVLRWIERHKGGASGLSGVVTVGFSLDRRGRLHHEHIVVSSGRSSLDRLTLQKLNQAAPFPRPPARVAWRTRDFLVNIDYRVRS